MIRPESPASLELYHTCPLAYKLSYVDRMPRLDFPYLIEGQLFHEAATSYFEHLYRSGQPTDFDFFREKVRELLPRVPHELQEDFLGLCRDFVESHAAELRGGEEVSVERELAVGEDMAPLDYSDPTGLLRGRVDVMIAAPDRVVILDFKTSWRVPPAGSEPPLQAAAYAVLASALRPDTEVEVIFDYVRWTAERRWTFGPEEVRRSFARLKRTVEHIRESTEFPPRVGAACQNCSFAHVCPELERHASNSTVPMGPIGPEEALELARQYRALEVRLKLIEEKLRAYCEKWGPIRLEDAELGWGVKELRSYPDPKPVVELLGKAGVPREEIWQLLSLPRQKLEKFLKRLKNPELERAVKEFEHVEKKTEFRWRKIYEARAQESGRSQEALA